MPWHLALYFALIALGLFLLYFKKKISGDNLRSYNRKSTFKKCSLLFGSFFLKKRILARSKHFQAFWLKNCIDLYHTQQKNLPKHQAFYTFCLFLLPILTFGYSYQCKCHYNLMNWTFFKV